MSPFLISRRTFVGAAVLSPFVRGSAAAGGLRAGASAVKITPSLGRTVYIAGYDRNRVAEAVHDDLWARALVLDDGDTRMAVVACDLIGLSNSRVRRIRRSIRGVPGENVLIACTHVHSGPDTLGLWGKDPLSSGIDPLYMERLAHRISAAVDAAARDLRTVAVSAGTTIVPDGLVHNSREPVQDKVLTALRLTDGSGGTVASVIHYGGHPEVNESRTMTSDFVHYVRQAAERRFGGVALFLNGALGGMVTPKIRASTFDEMRRVGEGVGGAGVEALEGAQSARVDRIRIRKRDVTLPLENAGFQALIAARVLDGEAAAREGSPELTTEVWRVDLGPITWLTIPGEILPRPAMDLKSKIPGRWPMVVALGNDELGYILDPADFDRDIYKYEKSMSVGKRTWPLLRDAAEELLK